MTVAILKPLFPVPCAIQLSSNFKYISWHGRQNEEEVGLQCLSSLSYITFEFVSRPQEKKQSVLCSKLHMHITFGQLITS